MRSKGILFEDVNKSQAVVESTKTAKVTHDGNPL